MPQGDRQSKTFAGRSGGFVRYELYLLLTLVLVAVALMVPRLLHGDGKGALLSLLSLAGVVLAALGLLLAGYWLYKRSQGADCGWGHMLSRTVSMLLRFWLYGFVGAVTAAALAANHHLGAHGENLAAGVGGSLTGILGTFLYQQLGRAQFWPAFGWFTLALLGSFIGGILEFLGPEPWAIDAGILIPMVLFLILALSGRVGPRQQ